MVDFFRLLRARKPVVWGVALVAVLAAGAVILSRAHPSAFVMPERVFPLPSPTPMPFAELTVPYLRGRSYDGTLGPREEVSVASSYTSYLTSYDSDGLKIGALMTIPSGQPPQGGWPAIVFVHGYIPPAQYKTLSQYADYVDFLARNGFVVLKIDLRGHGGSEGEAGGGYYSSDYVIDTLNAVSALSASGLVNPDAVGLWGHSMAGNVTLRAMAVKPDIPALVVWAGAVYTYLDQQQYGINDTSFRPSRNPTVVARRRELAEKVGSPSASSVFWQQVIPTNFLEDVTGAIQLHHAADDAVVDIGYSRGLAEILRNTAVEYQFHEYPTGGHNINGRSFSLAMSRTVEFYREHLK